MAGGPDATIVIIKRGNYIGLPAQKVRIKQLFKEVFYLNYCYKTFDDIQFYTSQSRLIKALINNVIMDLNNNVTHMTLN